MQTYECSHCGFMDLSLDLSDDARRSNVLLHIWTDHRRVDTALDPEESRGMLKRTKRFRGFGSIDGSARN